MSLETTEKETDMDFDYKVINGVKLVFERNSYRLENEQNFNLLIDLIAHHKNTYGVILQSKRVSNINIKYRHLLAWITDAVPKLKSPEYTLKTKIYWIFNDIHDFEKCANTACSSTTEHRNIIDLVKGYSHHKDVQLFHCSKSCAKLSYDTRNKIESTCIRKYGHKHHLQNKSIKLKATNTMVLRYGVKCAYQKPDIIEKARQAMIEKYGVEFPFQNKEILNYARDRLFEKYGVHYISQIPGYYENVIVPSNLKKYGIRNPIGIKSVQDKRQSTCLKKYGCTNVMQNRSIRIKQQTSMSGYQYDGNTFDSSWELIVHLVEKYKGSDITYNPNISFKYEYSDRQYTYFPDFQINGILVEVKGDQFFKPDGTMYCPYKHSWQTEDDYIHICEKFEAKHQCMIANNIKILRGREINEYTKLLNQSKYCMQIYLDVLDQKNQSK